ncbi:hypothetical protein PTKIN_Ptkin14bG0060200 [Pterospermum kingtungense]
MDENDWRANLFTIFINNLSSRLSRRVIWEAFNLYGVMVDVFVKFQSKKPFTFAFVRYKKESECVRAIAERDNCRIDGRFIKVKRAAFGWRNRRVQSANGPKTRLAAMKKPTHMEWKIRHHHSYKEVLESDMIRTDKDVLSSHKKVVRDDKELVVADKDKASVKCPMEIENTDEEILEFNTPEEELKWLENVILGRVKEDVPISEVRKVLKDNGVDCMVSPMGGVSVDFIFESCENLNMFLDKAEVFSESILEDYKAWDDSLAEREIITWIILEEVPLQLWNVKIFKAIGDSWGCFIRADDCTIKRERLDFGRILKKQKIYHTANCSFGKNSMAATPVPGSTNAMEIRELSSCQVEMCGGCFKRMAHSPSNLSPGFELTIDRRNQYEGDRSVEEFCNMGSTNWAIQVYNAARGELVDSGLGRAVCLWKGSGPGSNMENFTMDDDTGGPHIAAKVFKLKSRRGKKGKSVRCIKKKTRKEINEIMRYGRDAEVTTDSSVSDEEIEFRNSVISKEAIASCDVSNGLGVFFEDDRITMLEVFTSMEIEDRRSKDMEA